jgi:GalNAc-alpha-(1->4)-GalNAc-alpha-(1->3)-diNAcBac-PP-undecaprenol alpha-1,4-N-acetyl-D-galactosaminyltransferase
VRLALVISSLGAGGAERVMSTLANYWASNGKDVTLITLAGRRLDFFPIYENVNRIDLNVVGARSCLYQNIQDNLLRVKALRRTLRTVAPDVIVSFVDQTNVLSVMAAVGLKIPTIIAERSSPKNHGLGASWRVLRRVFYAKAFGIVVQTEEAFCWAQRFFEQRRIYKIPNPVSVDKNFTKRLLSRKSKGGIVMGMGRLSEEKGFDLLIRAFSMCLERHPDWSLIIHGEGQARLSLERLASVLGIAEMVFLPGLTRNPLAAIAVTDLFVLSSRYEGFPNVVLEAMACGVPVVSFDCRSGPREIIRDGVDGILVPPGDVSSLASAMERLMADKTKRMKMGKRAREVHTRFSLQWVMSKWELILKDAYQVKVQSTSNDFRGRIQ